jgi:4'-phosphopantetheinyl transferase
LPLFLINIKRKTFSPSDMAQLLPSRAEKVARFAGEADKKRCIAGGLLLARHLGVTKDSDLSYTAMGKPELSAAKQGASPRYFSLSHSGDYVGLLVSSRLCGLDIEKLRPFSKGDYPEGVARKCFTEAELAWLYAKRSGNARRRAFFKLWTAKEAILKALGLGLTVDLKTLEIPPHGPAQALNHTWRLKWRHRQNHLICTAESLPPMGDELSLSKCNN